MRRGKPNFEDPGGATLRRGNRKFQIYPGGGLDPSAHYGFVDESMFSLIGVVTDCSLLLLLVSGLSRFVVGGGFWKTARFDAVSLFRLEV